MKIIKKHFDLHRIAYPVHANLEQANLATKIYADYIFENITQNKTNQIVLLCRGSSGAILSTFVYNHLKSLTEINIHIQHIKKEGEKSHDQNFSNFGYTENTSFFIIDDFIVTGETIDKIINFFIENFPLKNEIEAVLVTGSVTGGFRTDFVKHLLAAQCL